MANLANSPFHATNSPSDHLRPGFALVGVTSVGSCALTSTPQRDACDVSVASGRGRAREPLRETWSKHPPKTKPTASSLLRKTEVILGLTAIVNHWWVSGSVHSAVNPTPLDPPPAIFIPECDQFWPGRLGHARRQEVVENTRPSKMPMLSMRKKPS